MSEPKQENRSRPGWTANWQLLLILLGYVILTGLYSWFTPPFEGPDEAQHIAYVTWLAEGKGFPPQGEAAWETPVQQEAGQSPLYYLLASIPARLVGAAESPAIYRPNPHFVGPFPRIEPDNDNRAIHYPTDAQPLQGGWLALYLARLLTMSFGVLLLVSVHNLARQIFPEQPDLALAAVLIVAVTPQVLFISSVASNDMPGAALSALTLYLLAVLLIRGPTLGRAVAVGVAYGLAVLTKASAITLLAPIGAGLIWLWLSHRQSLTRVLRTGIWLALSAFVVAGWWLIRSWILYGTPLGLETHDLTPWAIDDPAALANLDYRWGQVFRSFWLSLGWDTIRPEEAVYGGLLIISAIAAAGLILAAWRWQRRPSPRPDTKAALLMILTLAVVVVGVSLELWMRRVIAPYGRLMFPALAAVAVLLTTGWYKLHPKLPFIIAGLVLFLALLTPFWLLIPAYQGPDRLSPEAVEALSPSTGVFFGASAEEPIAELLSAKILTRSVVAGTNVPVELCWRPLAQTDRPYSVLVHLIGPDNSLAAQRRTYPGLGRFPTTIWQPDYVFCDLVQVIVWEDLARTLVYKTEIAMLDLETNERLPMFDALGNLVPVLFVGDVRLVSAEPKRAYVAPEGAADRPIGLVGSQFETTWRAGEVQDIVLHWGASQAIDGDYQVFVHLRDPVSGENVAQDDGPPFGGWYPTSWWPAGEVLVDQHEFPLPEGTPAGSYDLVVGFYDLASGQRFGEAFSLGQIEVLP